MKGERPGFEVAPFPASRRQMIDWLSLGGIARKPVVVSADDGTGVRAERIEVRECLAFTISLDHDVIDGAPAARFARRLKELIEAGPEPA